MEWLRTTLDALSGVIDIAVYAAIAAVFIIGIVKCVAPVASNRGMLRRGIRSLRNGSTRDAWQEDKFLGKGTLLAHWSEYLNNLFFADGAYHNASSVEDYINEDTVIAGPGRASFAEAVPGLLVSLGFMGTLIGLANGLSGFNMENSTAVQASIVTLIPGMRYAFMTSIAGVVASISFTLVNRAVDGSTERVLREFYSVLNRSAGVEAVDPMTQIAIYQQEQTALIQTMAKDLNGKFTEKLGGMLEQAVTPMTQAMRDFVTVSTREQMRFLDAVAQRFVDRMDDALKGQIGHLGDVMESVSKRQEDAFCAVDESMARAKEAMDAARDIKTALAGFSDSFDDYLESLASSRSREEEARVRIEGGIEKMSIVSREQGKFLAAAGDFTTKMEKAGENLAQGLEKLAQQSARRDAEIIDGMADCVTALRDAADEYARAGDELSARAGEELEQAALALRQDSADVTARLKDAAEALAEAAGALPDAVQGVTDDLLRESARFTDAFIRASQSLARRTEDEA